MTTVYFIRHGVSEANMSHEVSHTVKDAPLHNIGIEQSKAIGPFMMNEFRKNDGIKNKVLVLCSPLQRAMQTATHFLDSLKNATEQYNIEIKDIDVEIAHDVREKKNAVSDLLEYEHVDERESDSEFMLRVQQFRDKLYDLVEKESHDLIFVVSHHNFISMVLRSFRVNPQNAIPIKTVWDSKTRSNRLVLCNGATE